MQEGLLFDTGDDMNPNLRIRQNRGNYYLYESKWDAVSKRMVVTYVGVCNSNGMLRPKKRKSITEMQNSITFKLKKRLKTVIP
jgi:hypothetical protein